MEFIWNAVFILIPTWVFILIPFMTFFYEADDGQLMAGTAYVPEPAQRSKCASAICYETFVVLIIGAFFAVMYLVFGESRIPVKEYTYAGALGNGFGGVITEGGAYTLEPFPNSTDFDPFELVEYNSADDDVARGLVTGPEDMELMLNVSIFTFFGNLMAWVGWFFFALFGGIGLAALPLDLILTYVNRPRHMDAVEASDIQLNLRERVNELVDIGELIKIEREEKAQAGLSGKFAAFSLDSDKRKAARDERQAILGFKQAVYLLEQDVDDFQAATTARENYNPLTPYIALLLGICSVVISLFWFIHIIVYVYPEKPLAPFLNTYFQWFDRFFPLFGVLSVALFTVYLLICAVKGCFKFGMRFFFFHIHPMKVGKTYMSSFLFNTALVLLCALPVVQFCQQAFADYAAFSNIRQLFGVQVHYLQFFTMFWEMNIFIYAFMGVAVLTSVYLACVPTDTAANSQGIRDRLRARAG